MITWTIIWFLLLGVASGMASGLLGIGGGLVIVPALVLLFGFNQHQAQGTALALLVPPIGILAAWTYYKGGYVDLRAALFICMGFILGSFWGAKIATHLSDFWLTKIFGILLLASAVRLLFFK